MRNLLLPLLFAFTSALSLGPTRGITPAFTRSSTLRSSSLRASAELQADTNVEEADTAPEIVSFTEAALSQLRGMREKQGASELRIRMGVRAGGCSGMSYVMDLISEGEEVDDNDTVQVYEEGLSCVIDPKSLMFIFGMSLDYSDELIGGGFSFNNPNAETSCGCGKSFGV